jgi:transposase-like protein
MKAERVRRASYTLEYKLEAVRLVQGGQSCAATAKILGMPSQTLENWVRQVAKGQLAGAGAKILLAYVVIFQTQSPQPLQPHTLGIGSWVLA